MNRVHFIAIGGSAMHNLALALWQKGIRVTGSDDEIFEPARSRLLEKGLLPSSEGWFPEKIDASVEAVILGMHAKKDNPELLRAQELGVPIYSYPEFLYEQSKDKIRIVIGGSHGKTTITGMVLHALQQAGIETDYMVGAKLEGFDVMVKISDTARYMVFEGDEYLTSPIDSRPKFHLYRPHIALISGIAWDHINVFPTYEMYVDQFRQFIHLIENNGTLVYCAAEEELVRLCREPVEGLKKIPYSYPEHRISDGKSYVTCEAKDYGISVFGRHNLLNASGASMICSEIGVPAPVFWKSMGSFRGASNRLELVAENQHTRIFKDFAHAPSKVAATIRAMKEQYPDRRLLACLELHTYSSLSAVFQPLYKDAMELADEAIVYFNPHAISLKRLPDLSIEQVKSGFCKNDLMVCKDSLELFSFLTSRHWEGMNLLLMSSGNFDGMNLDQLSSQILR